MIYKKIPMTLKVMAAPTVASLFILPQQSVAQGLEEVIVTAQKRAENLQEVPVSVSALAGSDIEMLRFRDGADITAQIPNLQATNTMGDGFPIFSLRGVAMSDFSLNQASPVATYVDEVYKGNPAIQGKQIFDLERIEVLRGPQGTLYGKNSTGG
ncbi:MAG: Plug domain-containing protein, partial [Halieaceae bacterium]|nr:Plug domain-containing protein [Halieaceae bacterium]